MTVQKQTDGLLSDPEMIDNNDLAQLFEKRLSSQIPRWFLWMETVN